MKLAFFEEKRLVELRRIHILKMQSIFTIMKAPRKSATQDFPGLSPGNRIAISREIRRPNHPIHPRVQSAGLLC